VVGVLGEALECVSILCMVPESADLALLDCLEIEGHGNVVKVLQHQFQLEEAASVERNRDFKHKVNVIEQKLKQNTKSVCRAIEQDNGARSMLESFIHQSEQDGFEIPHEREGWHLLCCQIDKAKDVAYEALITTLEDESAKQEMLLQVGSREQALSSDRETLQTELNIVKRNRKREIAEMDLMIKRLNMEIATAEDLTMQEEQNRETEFKNLASNALQIHEENTTAIMETIFKLDENLKNIRAANDLSEETMRKKLNRQRNELESVITHYDSSMTSKLEEIEIMKMKHDKESERLLFLEKHFQNVDLENERIALEENEWQQYLSEQYAKEKEAHKAASGIQKLYRGWKGRELLKSSPGSKKKKK